MFHMKNLVVTGLEDAQLTAFRLHEPTRTIYMNFIADLKVTSEIILYASDKRDKIYSGTIELNAKMKMRSHYNFEINNDDNGLEHLCIGQETTECECITDPEFRFDEVLRKALIRGELVFNIAGGSGDLVKSWNPIVKAKLHSLKLAKRREKLVCKIAKRALPKLFEAYRQSCNPFDANRKNPIFVDSV